MPRVIQLTIRVRKKRLVLSPGTYCGQTTPTVRMSVMVRRRTRASHSSHALVAKLWSMVSPRPTRVQGIPESRQEIRGRSCQPPSAEVFDGAGAAGLVIGQLSDEREQRQIHGNNHAADHQT